MNEAHPTDDKTRQLEEIVAYLDGELSPQESAQVERRLASDEQYRRQLQGMERAWAALDELPAASVDDSFSKTTMEMVVDAVRSEVRQRTQALPLERRNRRLSTVLMVTAAALLGAIVFRIRGDNPNRALVADLPVIEYIDIYSQFREIDFLRQLNKELGGGDWAGAAEESTQQLELFQLVNSSSGREVWLESLTQDERVTLRAKLNRFLALSGQQQEKLRDLHHQIETAPDAAELQQTMLQYQQWLNSLPPSEQFELREKPPEERVRRVVQMVERQREREFLELTPDELRAVARAVQPRLEAMRKQAFESMSPEEREELESSFGRGRFWRLVNRIPPESRGELMRAVQEVLPSEKAAHFASLSPPERLERLLGWLRQATRADSPDRRDDNRRRERWISEQELEEFFVEEVDAAAKQRLLAMPRDRMQEQLRQMYEGNTFPRGANDPEDNNRDRRRGDGPPPRFEDRRGGPPRDQPFREDRRRGESPPDRGPLDRPPRFPPQGPPGPPPPPGN